ARSHVFFSSRRRHTRSLRDWSSDVCSSDLADRTNLLSEALRHYFYVVEGKNLRGNEQADPFWVKEAAVAAARLAEELQQWDVARSEERRVGKECRCRWRQDWYREKEHGERT